MSYIFVAITKSESPYMTHVLHDGSSAFTHMTEISSNKGLSLDKKVLVQVQGTAQSSQKELPIKDSPILSTPKDFSVLSIEDNVLALVLALNRLVSDGELGGESEGEADRKSAREADRKSEQDTHVIITWADNILQDITLYERILEAHTKYRAHYSFGEGYPVGVSPEVLSSKAIAMLDGIIKNASDTTVFSTQSLSRKSIFSVIEKQINSFDIETVLSPSDMREYRTSLAADSTRNFLIGKKLWEQGLRKADDIPSYYHNFPESFRAAPSYVYAQVSRTCFPSLYTFDDPNETLLDPSYSEDFISLDDWKQYLQKIKDFSPEAVLCIGYNGEISSHPQIGEILSLACQSFSVVYVETTGRGWKDHLDLAWWKEAFVKKIVWIVSVDAYETQTYSHIHKGASLEEVQHFISFLCTHTSSDSIYPQAVRMKENENELKDFLQFWEDKKTKPIIQKYNDFCQRLPSRKVINIAPLVRNACHHLARDLVVLMSGEIVMCSQAYARTHVLGSIKESSVEEVWNKNNQNFIKHVKKEYQEICRSCDEYYTVNV